MYDWVDDLLRRLTESALPFSPPEKRTNVPQWIRVLERVLSGQTDANIPFDDLCRLIERFDYHLDRVKGSHHIFVHPDRPEILNLQPAKGGKAKAYQVKEVRQVIIKYTQAQGPQGPAGVP